LWSEDLWLAERDQALAESGPEAELPEELMSLTLSVTHMDKTVLLREAVEALVTGRDGYYVDGTFGRGGHSRAILAELDDDGRLLAVDKDLQAVASAQELKESEPRFEFVHGSFAQLPHQLRSMGDGRR